MVEKFKNLYMSALNAELTGKPSPKDLFHAAVGEWYGLIPSYGFKAEAFATLLCQPMPFWPILRHLDRLSGAATVAALRGAQASPSARGGPYGPGSELYDEDPLNGLTDEDEDLGIVPTRGFGYFRRNLDRFGYILGI
eukprot:TRINITY_DN5730_c0_g1_i1.p2 TRINITY_DN5730_c0_g1~~TRINITY_DN5730_c0_g1_i1.p2  ORF type:complete len:138 (-),score=8.19 TRINITY_DN5730_c0_g1_i1:22-435(-)